MPALTFSARLQRFPPVLCRLLARARDGRRTRALSVAEIAAAAHMSAARVTYLSALTTWDTVPLADLLAFTRACGVDFDSRASMRLHGDVFRKARGLPEYLTRSRDWEPSLRHLAALYLSAYEPPATI